MTTKLALQGMDSWQASRLKTGDLQARVAPCQADDPSLGDLAVASLMTECGK
jgi:hypothetical protein